MWKNTSVLGLRVLYSAKNHSYLVYCYPTSLSRSLRPPLLRHLSLPWDELSYSLFVEIRALCYQPLCHNCFHIAVTFKSGAALQNR